MHQHHRPLLDELAADDDVLLGEARERDLDDGQLTQQLLDDVVDAVRVLGERLPELGVLQQHHRAEGQHRSAGLQAAGERTVGETAEVEVVDLVTVLADDLTDQARAGVVPLARGLGEQEVT